MDSANLKNQMIPTSVSLHSLWKGWIKRAFDVTASAIGLLLLSPFFIYITILIKREGPGHIFYRGPRSGKGGQIFGILKFRTMYETPASYNGPRVTAKGDSRITPLGQWLRDTKLNELPQLWNVLVGDMSLVGPRPEDPEIVRTWSAEDQAEILSVRPGITSPASILYRNEESMLSTGDVMEVYFREIVPDKLRLDRLYVRNHQFIRDLDILFWTMAALIPTISKTRIPEGRLFMGPLLILVRRYFSWFTLDFLMCLTSIALIGFGYRMLQPLDWGVMPFGILALGIAALFTLVNSFLGLDRVYWSRAGAEDGFLLILSISLSSILLVLGNSVLAHYPDRFFFPALPNEFMVMLCAFMLVGSLISRFRWRLLTSISSRWLTWRGTNKQYGDRVLIIGAGAGGEMAHWLLPRIFDADSFFVVGMVDDDPALRGMKVHQSVVLGSISEIPDLVRQHDIGTLVFAIHDIDQEACDRILRLSRLSKVRLIYLSDILQAAPQTRGLVVSREEGSPSPALN